MSTYLPWKAFEREVRNKLIGIGFTSRRLWAVQFEKKVGTDVNATDGKRFFGIQCKYGKKPNLYQAYREAKKECGNSGQIPLGVCRFKGTQDTVVVMGWRTFEKLVA